MLAWRRRSRSCTAKWGLIGFTKTLSIELGEYGIRVNANLPGAVDGSRIQRIFEGRAKVSGKTMEQIKKEAMSVQSLKRLVDPKDNAALALFLASDAAKSISGQMIPIDTTCSRQLTVQLNRRPSTMI
jgi:NAD(P)-dependent dehydrogenase (short-subunit alcohol dehydrogenase family)